MTVQANSIARDGRGWPPGIDHLDWLRDGPSHVAAAGALRALAQGAVRALTVDEEKGGPRYRVDYGFTDPTPPDPIEAVQSGRAFVSEA
jgi:hypothetical protein